MMDDCFRVFSIQKNVQKGGLFFYSCCRKYYAYPAKWCYYLAGLAGSKQGEGVVVRGCKEH